MVDDRRDTVIVEKEKSSSPLGWIIGIVVVIVLIGIFFYYGGFGLFGGSNNTNTSNPSGGSVNIETPDTINVQPTTGQ